MSLIYYLGYYDTQDNKEENRAIALAATNKMTYIISALEKLGHTVQIISPSATLNNRFYKGKRLPVGTRSSVKLFATWPYRIRLLRWIGRAFLRISSMCYLLHNIKKDDTVIVYHSLALINCVKWLKKLRNCRLIMEIEEFYGDVMEKQKVSDREQKYFQIADGYLFPAKQLEEKVNVGKKPYTLIHGTYQTEWDRKCRFIEPEYQNKIHCVYAGTLDPRKGGAENAVNAAMHLSEQFHIHILGFGHERELEHIREVIDRVRKTSQCTVTYDGCFSGEAFVEFLQKCQIGLSTQNPEGIYNDTSFPSKILTYMANGLQVVTVRIPVVERSAVDRNMHYYNAPIPEEIAAAIRAAAESDQNQDGRSALLVLDAEFTEKLEKLLEAV